LPAAETLIEALQTGDIAGLSACGAGLATARDSQGQSWFFIALEVGGLPTVQWFLAQGALAAGTDRSGRSGAGGHHHSATPCATSLTRPPTTARPSLPPSSTPGPM
jgi:hypothetical protein